MSVCILLPQEYPLLCTPVNRDHGQAGDFEIAPCDERGKATALIAGVGDVV